MSQITIERKEVKKFTCDHCEIFKVTEKLNSPEGWITIMDFSISYDGSVFFDLRDLISDDRIDACSIKCLLEKIKSIVDRVIMFKTERDENDT